MCRFILFKGVEPILLADLLTRPAHSIINQSFDSRLRIDLHRPLNGDGFGVGWYDPVPPTCLDNSCTAAAPCIFTSILPAWNNLNLHRLAEKIRSALVFAHIRAASPGFAISESNCHPWQYGRLMWMHNGYIAQFGKIKRRLQSLLRDELYAFVQGNTDSEFCFALFLNQFEDPLKGPFTVETMKDAMLKLIQLLNQFSAEADITDFCLMNFAVTDGKTVICTRYTNQAHVEPASLYYSTGTRFEGSDPMHYRMVSEDKRSRLIIVASGRTSSMETLTFLEPLTFERADWSAVPANTLIAITSKQNMLFFPIPENIYDTTSGQAKIQSSC